MFYDGKKALRERTERAVREYMSKPIKNGRGEEEKEAINQLQSLMDQWDEPLKKTFQNTHQGYQTETLIRFLKAREWDVGRAHKMLVDCLQWRIENKIDNILAKPIIPTNLLRAIQEPQLIGLSGYSKQGASSRIDGTKAILSSTQISEPTTNHSSDVESDDAAATMKKDDVCRAKRGRRAGARRTRAKEAVRKQRQEMQLVEPTLLLTGLRNHPSVYSRLGQLPPRHNLAALNTWNRAFSVWSTAADVYKELLHKAGFGDFLSIQDIKLDLRGYMSAVVERYFSETHTLHLGTFEIGPTPVAWTMITGIRFGGDPLNTPAITDTECAALLGLEGTKGFFSSGKLKLENLCPPNLDFSKKPAKENLEWMFRRLTVYLVGSCFFSGTDLTVPVGLVSAMSNINRINQYDWGAATFAAFLRGMRLKTSDCHGNYSGFYAFLLLWAYEHLPCMRPLSEWGLDTFPRARRWKSKMEDPTLVEFILIRLELEYLKEDEVDFEPYKELLGKEDFQHEVALSMKQIAFKGLESWEMYMGERNLRQFGGLTRVPCSPPVTRFCDGFEDLTQAFPLTLLQGINAWDLVEDEECDYDNWFRTNSLGRIVAAEHIPERMLVARQVLELWLLVHKDGHKVMPPQEVQTLQKEKAKEEMAHRKCKAQLNAAMKEIKALRIVRNSQVAEEPRTLTLDVARLVASRRIFSEAPANKRLQLSHLPYPPTFPPFEST